MLHEQMRLVASMEATIEALNDLGRQVSESGVGYLGSTPMLRGAVKIGLGLEQVLRGLLPDEKERAERYQNGPQTTQKVTK